MTRVLYNGRCPICRAEISHYARRAEELGLPLVFEDLHNTALERWHLTPDAAMRRLHAQLPDGTFVSGIAAFATIWDHLPRLRWMARAVRWPGVGTAVRLAYDHVAAPVLYNLHLRRERLGSGNTGP